ncbi:MAG: ECF-type sigma factor, partial [Phycisphaerales bacterium]
MSCSIEREEEEGIGGAASRPASRIRSIADGFGEIYPQLRSMASTLMRQERASHTLQPTAVVSEAFLRLAHRDPS